ncbi:MAG: metallophosphoesterase [Coriobacteriales bacterium]|nr:metallophosphoesterase [Coriobacteriales bacterium]
MKVVAISDIHGCLDALQDALRVIEPYLQKGAAQLVFCGDYIHGRDDSYEVCETIIALQENYGADKVVALLGNHEKQVLDKSQMVDEKNFDYAREDRLIEWFKTLPLYYETKDAIFVHAGINEDVGEGWPYESTTYDFLERHPARIGAVKGLNKKVVAGHAGTYRISGDSYFHKIFYDGASHYYIDGTVVATGYLPILMLDSDKSKFYEYDFGS